MERSRPLSQWKQWIVLATVASLAVFVWEAVSDEPPPAEKPPRVPVAVIDIGKVFKDQRPFNERMAGIKLEIEVFERSVRARQAEIAGLTTSDPVKAKVLAGELTAEIAAKRKLFLEREAEVYFEIYSQIEKDVAAISKERDIGLVLRINSDPMVPGDRASVLQGVNRAVVHTRVPDLTIDVVNLANNAKPAGIERN